MKSFSEIKQEIERRRDEAWIRSLNTKKTRLVQRLALARHDEMTRLLEWLGNA